jgi:hypothetical protein
MKRFLRRWPVVAVLAAIATLGWAPTADAAFQTRYQINGGGFTTVSDGDAADTNPLTGRITVNIGGGLIIDTAISNAAAGNPFLAALDLSVDGNLAAGSTLDVQASDVNYGLTPPSGGNYAYKLDVTGTWGGGTASESGFMDTSNTQFGMPGAPYQFGPLTLGQTTSGSVAGTSPFSLTLAATFTSTNFDEAISSDTHLRIATPAPAGLTLAIAGLSALGGFGFLRRRKVALT